jgi:hypothetical protein
MDLINRILKGIHSDNDPNYQPEGTLRKSQNGRIISHGEGSYVWETIKGNKLSFLIGVDYDIAAWCVLRDKLYVLGWEDDPTPIMLKFYSVTMDYETGEGSATALCEWNDPDLNLSKDHPIRKMIGVYESDTLQRIYFTDFYNYPRIITIQNGVVVNTSIKFLDFTPDVDNALGSSCFSDYVTNGSLYGGSYFFTWRYYTNDGYFTDWSYLTKQIPIAEDASGTGFKDHQNYDGCNFTTNTDKGIRIDITNIDDDYDCIQVAYFASSDFNSLAPGVIFYDGEITSTSMTIELNGAENLGSLLIEDLFSSDIVINSVKDFATIRGWLAAANINERPELDLAGKIVGATITHEYAEIVLDYAEDVMRAKGDTGMADAGSAASLGYVLAGQFPANIDWYGSPKVNKVYHIKAGIWYRADAPGIWKKDETGTSYNITKNSRFFATEPGYIVHTHFFSVTNHDGKAQFNCSTPHGYTAPGDFVRIYSGMFYQNGYCTIDTIDSAISFTVTAAYPSLTDSGYTCPYFAPIIRVKKYSNGITPATIYYNEYEYGDNYWDYKNPMVCQQMLGYPGGETIRLGVEFLDKKGKPYFVRWLGDYTTPLRDIGEEITTNAPSKCYHGGNVGSGTYYYQCNGQVMSLNISGIDVTDFKDEISGFSIVRAPIERQYIAHGIIENTYKSGDNTYMYSEHTSSDDATHRREKTYNLIIPEHLFGADYFNLQDGDIIKNCGYFAPYESYRNDYPNVPAPGSTVWRGFGTLHTANYKFYSKFYIPYDTDVSNSNGVQGVETEIDNFTLINIGDNDIEYDPDNTNLHWKNTASSHGNREGAVSTTIIVKTKSTETATNPINRSVRNDTLPMIHYVAIKRALSNPYGGTSDSLLANTSYLSLGHFQEVNSTILAQVKNGSNRYVFNDVQVFGGDTFIGIFDFCRLLYDDGYTDGPVSQSIAYVTESRINLALRDGRHILRNMCYATPSQTDGILYHPLDGEFQLEEFNYNDGYSTSEVGAIYPAYPFPFILTTNFDTRIRWSLHKNNGEQQDMFRRFLSGNKLDLENSQGPINNIATKFNNLIYWQDDAIGYIPVDERQLVAGQLGESVQIGVGDAFERYDERDRMIGNQHQFGLIESEFGFHWVDLKRMIVVSMNKSLAITMDSIVKGFNNELFARILPTTFSSDNPFKYRGIVAGYDPEYKFIYFSFKQYITNPEDNDFTIAIDAKLNAFAGFHTFNTMGFVTWGKFMLAIANNTLERQAYVYGMGEYRDFYGVKQDAYLELVVRDPNMIASIFDNIIVTGNDDFFNRIDIDNGSDTTYESILDSSGDLVNRNFGYRNGKWLGTLPVATRERLADSGYLKIKFTVNDDRNELIRFIQMITKCRKTY